jgi:hypothetical protein
MKLALAIRHPPSNLARRQEQLTIELGDELCPCHNVAPTKSHSGKLPRLHGAAQNSKREKLDYHQNIPRV